ncbi:hypothetical protein ASD8599_01381 [Ascidiaceihabitans donghaensis]|uniref:Uncharacterized protein n=1 Tax=Ascidiaceihabitans donghaensis TaxID=1510460 RepID=A0A2R8BC77_9RHOB|nr:hypothetical protein [Ascidiaceihabitans donghaensis]SPH20642.1 hypothetical protein ASD8599_01381 [Ascidiaceihabitans donghaensis]
MFEHLQRQLRTLSETTEISVPLEADSEGFLDKECPSETCLFQFKILEEDWKKIVRDEEVFCPSCRHNTHAQSWFTAEQIESAKEYAMGQITNDINAAMRADAAASKRRTKRNSFISITLEAKGGRDAVLLPVAAANPMRLRTTCEECGCRYSYVGAAYFCPSCGQNSASHTFSQTLEAIRTAAGLGSTLREALGPDEAEAMARTLLEKAMQDTVMSFQRVSEQFYERKTGRPPKRNVFQRLDTGSGLWEAELGVSYTDILGLEAMKQLVIYYQQRHLLAHQQGIVDTYYLTRSQDTRYSIGQRLIIREPAVLDFAAIIEKLGEEIMRRCTSE